MNWLIIFSTFPPHLHLKELRLEQQLVKLVLEGDKLSSTIRMDGWMDGFITIIDSIKQWCREIQC